MNVWFPASGEFRETLSGIRTLYCFSHNSFENKKGLQTPLLEGVMGIRCNILSIEKRLKVIC